MARRYLLGFDVGSSSVKASLTDIDSGEIAASAFYPDHEAPIMAVKAVVGQCQAVASENYGRD